MTEQTRWATPEWVVPTRDDALMVGDLRDGWTVGAAPLVRGAPYTDFGNHRMSVPEGDSPRAVAVRVHEMIHAAISPAEVPGELLRQLEITPEAVALAEEVRVNYIAGLMSKGIIGSTRSMDGTDRFEPWPELLEGSDGSEVVTAKDALSRGDWRAALSLYLATRGTNVESRVKRILNRKPEWKEALVRVDKTITTHFPKRGARRASDRGYYARSVADTDPTEYKYARPGSFGKTKIETVILPYAFTTRTLPLATIVTQWLNTPPTDAPGPSTGLEPDEGRSDPYKRRGGVDWAKMIVGMTSLTEPTRRFVGRRKRPAITGKAPRRPDRLLTDPERRIFSETVRGVGGVVVFDCSGSMRVSWQEVSDVVEQYAGATVIAYSMNGDNANTWVLAKDGRMISRESLSKLHLGRGNGVDGPVLRYALRHRRSPKDFVLWVTDGLVTGEDDGFSDKLQDECAMLCHRHRITTVRDAERAVEILRESRSRGRLPYCHIPAIENAIVRALNKTGEPDDEPTA